MKRFPPVVLKLELGFADKDKTLRLLQALAPDTRVSVNIVKARITETSASLQLELRGQTPRLFEVATLLQQAATEKDPSWRPFSRVS